ncbi:MAG: 4-hydroxy-tetrahydrodipicolinate reductase [Marinilabiliaceae bacterium]|nr:4-hydroxy-tetrahydrodipicolinate reductase [Marinilabiliaceae bacterium]
MKIAIIGYGKMGHVIEEIAKSRGHQITCHIDIDTADTFDCDGFADADLAIEFTTPKTAYNNYLECFKRNKPVVSGTTGWLDKLDDIRSRCDGYGGKQTFFYSSNFSLGVNIFAEINRQLARLMNQFDEYDVNMTETHHVHKLDAPSGTAISLAQGIVKNLDRKSDWVLSPEQRPNAIQIASIRQFEVPGIHTIHYESDDDFIEITHSAKSRRGLAYGVVLAAEYTACHKGFLEMKDMLGF